MTSAKRLKIGVFDSGVGGITVLSELKRRFGYVDYIYLGDTAHVPYGTKSPAQIEKLSRECAQTLKKRDIDGLVVACNTASAWALGAIEEVMSPVPVFGVLSPGVEAALEALSEFQQKKKGSQKDPPILVLATRATVMSKAYGTILRKILNPYGEQSEDKVPVIEQACPILVPMIEEGWVDHPILHQTIQEYVGPHLKKHSSGVALLACTHYPWIHSAFEKALPGWTVVNSAQAIAQCLQGSELFQGLSSEKYILDPKAKGRTEWIFTDPLAVPDFARQWVERNQ